MNHNLKMHFVLVESFGVYVYTGPGGGRRLLARAMMPDAPVGDWKDSGQGGRKARGKEASRLAHYWLAALRNGSTVPDVRGFRANAPR